jgi:hypothetical protein
VGLIFLFWKRPLKIQVKGSGQENLLYEKSFEPREREVLSSASVQRYELCIEKEECRKLTDEDHIDVLNFNC